MVTLLSLSGCTAYHNSGVQTVEEPSDLSSRLMNRLLAALLVRDLQFSEGAQQLARLGMAYEEVAVVFATTPASVRAAVSRGRRKDSKADGT